MAFPTMIQQFEAAKSARGSRLGRAPVAMSTMTQYGYSTPGTNITVSPTFSNIGSPNISVGGLSTGDIALGGGGTTGGGGGTIGGGGGGGTIGGGGGGGTIGGGGGGGTIGGGGGGGTIGGGGATGGGKTSTREPVGTTLKTSSALQEAIKKAAKKGQPGAPRVTRGELKSIAQQSDLGPRGLRNALYDAKVQVGGKAADYLNRQLGKVGAKPIPKVETKSDPTPRRTQTTSQGVIGLINLAGKPGTTNLKNFPQQQTGSANKASAKRKTAAKANKKK